jgi:hypothetical protein
LVAAAAAQEQNPNNNGVSGKLNKRKKTYISHHVLISMAKLIIFSHTK